MYIAVDTFLVKQVTQGALTVLYREIMLPKKYQNNKCIMHGILTKQLYKMFPRIPTNSCPQYVSKNTH